MHTVARKLSNFNAISLLFPFTYLHSMHEYFLFLALRRIPQVTEFCTYGSMFDFLHSMDWMVTDERDNNNNNGSERASSVQSNSVNSYAEALQGRNSGGGGGGYNNNNNNNAGYAGHAPSPDPSQQSSMSSASTAATLTPAQQQLLQQQTPPHSPIKPQLANDSSTWPVFTQLATPPPSPAQTPAAAQGNNFKRISQPLIPSGGGGGGGGIIQSLLRRTSSGRDRRESDVEKGYGTGPEIHMSGMRSSHSSSGKLSGSGGGQGGGTAGSGSGGGNAGSSSSESKNSSNIDVAAKLAEALNSQYLPETLTSTQYNANSGGGGGSVTGGGGGRPGHDPSRPSSWSASLRNVSEITYSLFYLTQVPPSIEKTVLVLGLS